MPFFGVKTTEQLSAGQERKRRNRRRSLTRAAIQLLFFVSMPGAYVAGFNGIKYIFRQLSGGGLLEWNSFVTALAGLGVFTIIFGRFFCGYICAFGSLGDFVYWLSGLFQKKILKKKKQVSIPQTVLPWLQKLKYVNLAFILIVTAMGWSGALQGTSAWDVFSRLTAFRLPDRSFGIGILCLAVILVGMGIQSRFFCQFLCPMGAFFATLPILPFMALRRDPANCLKECNACRNTCPAGLKLEPDGLRSGECLSCEKCIGICPKNNLHYPAGRLFKKEVLYILFRAAVFFVLGAWTGLCRFL